MANACSNSSGSALQRCMGQPAVLAAQDALQALADAAEACLNPWHAQRATSSSSGKHVQDHQQAQVATHDACLSSSTCERVLAGIGRCLDAAAAAGDQSALQGFASALRAGCCVPFAASCDNGVAQAQACLLLLQHLCDDRSDTGVATTNHAPASAASPNETARRRPRQSSEPLPQQQKAHALLPELVRACKCHLSRYATAQHQQAGSHTAATAGYPPPSANACDNANASTQAEDVAALHSGTRAQALHAVAVHVLELLACLRVHGDVSVHVWPAAAQLQGAAQAHRAESAGAAQAEALPVAATAQLLPVYRELVGCLHVGHPDVRSRAAELLLRVGDALGLQ